MRTHGDQRVGRAALLSLVLATALSGCAGAATGTGTAVGETAGAEPPDERQRHQMLSLHMDSYFWMALEARDALIAGRLNRARVRMRALSELDVGARVPAEWLPDIDQMTDAAKQVAVARDVPEASNAMGRVAVACGACHGKVHAGPLPFSKLLGVPSAAGGDFTALMLRHQWAADALWSGLTRPSEAEWRAGAEALADSPPLPPTKPDGTEVSEAQKSAIEVVRSIGRKALAAETPQQRGGIYAEFLQSCSRCHG